MKIVLYTNDLRLTASPMHGWQGVFLNFQLPIRRTGSPVLGRRHSSHQMDRLITTPASNLNNMIFIGNITYNQFRIHCNEFCSLMWYEPFIKNCYLIKSGDSKNQIQWIFRSLQFATILCTAYKVRHSFWNKFI